MNNVETADVQRVQFAVVIPAHNEAHRIGETLATLLTQLDSSDCAEILVVDDASGDQTLDIVDRFANDQSSAIPVRSTRVASGRGKGAAIRWGVATARSDVAVLVDADLPVSAHELVILAARVASADLVLGSRRMEGSSFEVPQPFARRLGGLIFRTCASSLGFRGGSDPQCGAKAMRIASVGPILAECVSDDFALDAELIERCRRAGCSIVEVPVRWCHRPGSTVRPVRDFLRTVRSLRDARAPVIGARAVSPNSTISVTSDLVPPKPYPAHENPVTDSVETGRGARNK